jgi:hypothetical protein
MGDEMVNLGIQLSHKEAQALLDELWFLKQLRIDDNERDKVALLENVFQIFSEQMNSARPMDDERWADLMKELAEIKEDEIN